MKRRLIKQGQEKGEIRKQEDNQYKANIPKELADIGFTPKKFSTYKHIADIPEQDFKAFGKYYRELEDKKDVKLSLSKLTMISDKQQVQEEIGKFRKAGIAPFGHLIYKSSF